MYRVMIVDDEPIIVEGLSRSIPWEQWDCEVIATAFSGEEGSEVIRKEQPDILFSDICMPGISGLTMIAGLKSEFPKMQITILTGFRDFEYAREAIHLGVTRFLLKPSKMDELKEAVEAMTIKLRQEGVFPDTRQTENGWSGMAVTEEPAGNILKPEEEKVSEPQGNLEEPRAITVEAVMGKTVKNDGKRDPDGHKMEGMEDSAASSFIVNNAMAFIEKNYKEKLKLSDVAEQVYVSQWHLSKLLNRYTGQSFSDLLNHVRIERAKELLKDPSLRIGDIAEQVGFLDMAHFSRVFKKQAGLSANEFRNKRLR